jgi:hypothetical protein
MLKEAGRGFKQTAAILYVILYYKRILALLR